MVDHMEPEILAEIEDLIERAHDGLAEGDIDDSMRALVEDLSAVRGRLEPARWQALARSTLQPSKVGLICREDPMTQRAFLKPRGYPGDARLLDYIYFWKELWDTDLFAGRERGRRLNACTGDVAACHAVRRRVRVLSEYLDQLPARCGSAPARVLSLACGHLREAQRSEAVADGAVAELVAIDHDPKTLAVLSRGDHSPCVKPRLGSVIDVLMGKIAAADMDLVYASGLYDYLDQDLGRALARKLLEMTRPGGVLLIPNILPDVPSAGYYEGIMDWWLTCRSEGQMLDLLGEVPREELAGARTFVEAYDNIVFLEATRA